MLVNVFPGQGSQYKGMGRDWFEEFPDYTAAADRILGYSIRDLCLSDRENRLRETQYTQPAMYVVNALAAMHAKRAGAAPAQYLAGHSLGEYNALLAAEVFDFETGLRLVRERASLMAQASPGGMAAVIGLDYRKIEETLTRNGFGDIDIANVNSPSEIVISGPKERIAAAKSAFENASCRMYVVLNVSAAFHSRYMRPASERFTKFLKSFRFRPPVTPVISNVEAKPYTAERVGELLSAQISRPVRWCDSMQYLLSLGAVEIQEIGPGKVLTKLADTIRKTAPPANGATAPLNGQVASPALETVSARPAARACITAQSLGSAEFKKDYGIEYAYLSGAMYKGIASRQLVIRMGKAGMMGFLGTGGMRLNEIEDNLHNIQNALAPTQSYGMNLLCNLVQPEMEDRTVDIYLARGVRNVEAAAYMQMTPSLVRFRLKNIRTAPSGQIEPVQRIVAKVSRPEVAEVFLSPPPARILQRLISEGKLTETEARLGERTPVADDICVEADSGGHTDQGHLISLVPSMIRLREEIAKRHGFERHARIGAAGGIGTPESAGAAFLMGADFVLTGSINQCTVEAGTSDAVKDMLQEMNVQDTAYCPAGDMFEIGAKIQVFKKGLFFPARANKLYDLYRNFNSLEEIDENTKRQIQEKYFRRSFDEVWAETKRYLQDNKSDELAQAEQNPKRKMALIFRWYFVHTSRLALEGMVDQKVDFQIHCGRSLGAFNQWVKGTKFEKWRDRHVDEIGKHLMEQTALYLEQRCQRMLGMSSPA